MYPQFWPEDLEHAGKRVVIVGSGATAITSLPNCDDAAENSWVYPNDRQRYWEQMVLSDHAHLMVVSARMVYVHVVSDRCIPLFRAFPTKARKILESGVATLLPASVSTHPHTQPSYKPRDQRLYFSPNIDVFEALRNGTANIATGKIRTIKSNTIVLETGDKLQTDVRVTATGLKLVVGGGIQLAVDGRPVRLASRYV